MGKCPFFLLPGLISAVLMLPVAGCGGDDDGNDEPETERITFKLPTTTKQVSDQEAESVLELKDEGATIVFSGGSPIAGTVAPGDILMFGITPQTPDGLLRKVKSVARVSGLDSESETDQVWIETDEATMEEAFEELDMVMDREVEYEQMESMDSALNGLAIRRSPLSASRQITFELGFDGTVLHDADGDMSTTHDQIVANGSIGFTLRIYLAAQIRWFRMEYIKAGGAVTQFGKLEVRNTLAGMHFKKEVVVGTLYFAPFSLGPVVIRPRLQLVLGVTGELSVQIVTSIEEEMGLEAGVEYRRGRGWKPFSNTWSYWDFMPPTLSATASVKAYVGPRFTLLIYGVAGPWAQLVAYLRLVADTTANPLWKLFGGLEASIGIEGKILGFRFLQWRMDGIVDMSTRIASAPCQCAGLECGPDPTCDFAESCGECDGADSCLEGECVQPCVPDCTDLECGTDPVCGQSCGQCAEIDDCEAGVCIPKPLVDTWQDPESGLTWQQVDMVQFDEVGFPDDFTVCQDRLGPGWRVPDIDDLRTLIRGCDSSASGCPAMEGPADGCYWPSELKGSCSFFWSSTPQEDCTGCYLGVHFNTGNVGPGFSMNWIRCVSGSAVPQ